MLGPSSYHLKGCAPSGSELRNKRAGLLQSEGRTCTFSAVRWTGRRVERSRDMERQVGACREVCRARLGRRLTTARHNDPIPINRISARHRRGERKSVVSGKRGQAGKNQGSAVALKKKKQ